jgi:zinc protease
MIPRLPLFAVLASAAFAQVGMPPPLVPAAPKPAPRPAAPVRAAIPTHRDLKFAPLRPIELPQPVRFQLSNGMKVLLVEDRERPRVTAVATVRTGTLYDPPGRSGLATMTAALLRSGGTGRKAPDRLDADLDTVGASIESNIGDDLGSVSLNVLKENLAEGLSLYRDVLTEPAFRQDRIDSTKAFYLQGIARRNDDPRELLRREFSAALYGRASIRRPEYASIGPIARGDLLAFYRRHYFPANVLLTVAGDFDAAQLQPTLETLFGSWKAQQPPVPELPKPAPAAPGAYLAVKRPLADSYVAIGQAGGLFTDPDAAALEVAAAILGIGPRSRLLRRARLAGGAVREIRADWHAGFGSPGTFQISGAGMANAAGDIIKLVVEEVQKLRAAEPTDDELRAAREVVIMKFVSGLDNRTNALSVLANFEYFGLPSDALQQFQKAVAAVTRADVLRVAKARFDPQNFTSVVVSNQTAFAAPIDPRGGAATQIDLTIAEPAAGTAPPTAAAAELGRKLLQRAQQASGGADLLAAVKDYSQSAVYTLHDGTRENQTDRWIAPSTLRQDYQSLRGGTLVRFTDGKTGWLSNGRASTALTGTRLKQSRSETLRVYIPMLLSDRIPGRVIAALDEQTVEITEGDVSARIVFDPQTGLPSAVLHETGAENQPVVFVDEELSDFRDVNGIKLPFAITVRNNGAKYSDGVLSDVKVNQGLKIEVLQRRP